MISLKSLFGGAGRWVIDYPPENVDWRPIRPRPGQPLVRARRAEADCVVDASGGPLHARGGRDFIVEHETGARAVVRGDIFARVYEPVGDGRSKAHRRYFPRLALDRPALVHIEGPQRQNPAIGLSKVRRVSYGFSPRADAVKKYDDA